MGDLSSRNDTSHIVLIEQHRGTDEGALWGVEAGEITPNAP